MLDLENLSDIWACILSKGMIIEPFLEHFSDMDSVEFILLQEKLSHKNRLNSLNVIARMWRHSIKYRTDVHNDLL